MKNFIGAISAVFIGLMITLARFNNPVDNRKIRWFYRCGSIQNVREC